jgi:hypothetical protein
MRFDRSVVRTEEPVDGLLHQITECRLLPGSSIEHHLELTEVEELILVDVEGVADLRSFDRMVAQSVDDPVAIMTFQRA